jgi:hypothetical protein
MIKENSVSTDGSAKDRAAADSLRGISDRVIFFLTMLVLVKKLLINIISKIPVSLHSYRNYTV